MPRLLAIGCAVCAAACGVANLEMGSAGPDRQTQSGPEGATRFDAGGGGGGVDDGPGGGGGAGGGTACVPEVCGNGLDDDCDGKVDGADLDCPPVRHHCEDTEGHNCGGDMGYGDHCAAADNTGGCSAARFAAWCNRRNPATPDVWDNWVRGWVDSRCDGEVTESGTQYNTFSCRSSDNHSYDCTTPLVLLFAPAGRVELGRSAGAFSFAPGAPRGSDWPTSATPWLVRDLDGDGAITSGRELFGSQTVLPSGARARQGFEALAALDANHDGQLDRRDPAFAQLALWADRNADRRSTPDELTRLDAAGVTALSLDFRDLGRCDPRGNCERESAPFSFGRGGARHGVVVDLHLRTWLRRPENEPPGNLAASELRTLSL